MNIGTEESITILCQLIDGLEDKQDIGTQVALSAIRNAVDALMRQTSLDVTHDGIFVICSRCGKTILPVKHCPECGQALKL